MRRSMLIPLLVISLGAPLLMSACNSQGKGEEGVGDVVEQINLNEKTSGQTFKLDKDGVVSIDIKASSGTPYAWKVTNSSPAVLTQSGKAKVSSADMPGAEATTTYKFRAKKLGTSELTFALTSITDPTDVAESLTTTIKVKNI